MHHPEPTERRWATNQRWRNSVLNVQGFTMRHRPSADSNSPRSILRQPSAIDVVLVGRHPQLAAANQGAILEDVDGATQLSALSTLMSAQGGLVRPPGQLAT